MNNQDVGTAIDFLVEEKAKKEQKREEDICRRNEIMWVSQINLEINYSLSFCCYIPSGFDRCNKLAGSRGDMG